MNGGVIEVRYPIYRELLAECMRVLDVKGEDYTIGNRDKDRLHNFRTVADALGLPMEQAWAVYFYKHVASVLKYARHGKVESEPIRGRVIDCINYLLLFALIVEEKESHERQAGPELPSPVQPGSPMPARYGTCRSARRKPRSRR